MTDSNVDVRSLVIVRDGQRTWLGLNARPAVSWFDGCGLLLQPAWEYLGDFVQQPTQFGRPRLLVPIDWLTNINSVTVRPVSVISLESLTDAEVREFEAMIRQCDDLRQQIRAKQSGIELAVKVPKLGGGVS